jgi:threonine dehydrogenase-like Zn-dependent dehydrogenase
MSLDEVWIRVAYAGLCRTDVLVAQGEIPVHKERILGHECSGVISYVPTDSHLSVGMPVTINPLLSDGFIGIDRDGVFAEKIAVPPSAVVQLPETLSLCTAAFTEPIAAALAIFNTDIHPLQKGLVLGTGRIALLTSSLLSLRGFKTITVAKTPPLSETFDFVIETNIHAQSMDKVLSCLCDGGLLILKSRMNCELKLPSHKIVRRGLRVQGVHYGSFYEAVDILEKNKLPLPFLGPSYSLSDFVKHFFDCEDQKIFCKPSEKLTV